MTNTFPRVLKFLQIKEGWTNFWGEPTLQNVWILWSPILYFNLKSFLDSNSSSFIRFQCILYDPGLLLSGFSNLYKLKSGDLISGGGGPIFQNVWIIWSPLLYLSLKNPRDPTSLSFIRFQSILHEWGRLLSESWNFYKLRRGELISGGNPFFRMSDLFGPLFCISILKVLWTQILRHSLHFSPFCMNQEDFSQSLEISTN